ncbi:MAG: TatD family hydrolase [Actinomycetales bacterium]
MSWPPAPEPLPLPVVDDHCHLDIPAASRDEAVEERSLADALAAAAAVNVPRAVQVGYDLASSRWSVEAAASHPQLLAAVALHPNEAPRLAASGRLDEHFAGIEQLVGHERVRAIGETGLDTFRTGPDGAAAQEESFRRHIDLAKRSRKALQIHDRDAHADVLRILAEEGAPERTVLHCFSGDAEMAGECVRRGYVLSIAGTVTFNNAGALRAAVEVTPIDLLQVETDAPYLTPVPYRGRPNAGYLVPLTVRAIAEIKGCDLDQLCTTLAATAERLYGPW